MESAISKLCKTVFEKIDAAVAASTKTKTCRLVGASKTKSVEVMMEAYNAGVRHFGENYTDEIVKKAPLVKYYSLKIQRSFWIYLIVNDVLFSYVFFIY